MRICQVTTGMIPIRPVGQMGWGAVEKIVREYKASLEALGHEVDIKHMNEVNANEYDFVHIHMGNLALELHRKGIPYVFSLHDHHTEHYGKGSYCFNHNLEAMKKSIFAITHAEYLVDYFDDTDKLFYLSHGVNTSFFRPSPKSHTQHKLLMVANNGLAGDSGFDRKGFRYGVEVARELDLPITIVGTETNQKFFEIHSDIGSYHKLNLVATNPSEDDLLRIYNDHTIFLHPSMLEAGHPNLTLLEAASCAIPMVATYRGSRDIVGLHRLNELTTSNVLQGVKETIDNYDNIKYEMIYVRDRYDWSHVCKELSGIYHAVSQFHNLNSDTIKNRYYSVYNNTEKI